MPRRRFFSNIAPLPERILGTGFLGPVPPQPGSRRRQPRPIGEQLRRDAGPAAGQRRDPVRGNPHTAKTAGAGQENVALQEPLVAAYQKRYKAGIANSYPGYFQLLSNLENTRALIPQLEISLRQANNQLCILLGQPVHDLLPELGDGTVPDPSDPNKRVVRIPRPRGPLGGGGHPG